MSRLFFNNFNKPARNTLIALSISLAGLIGTTTASHGQPSQNPPALEDIYSPEMLKAYKGFQTDADIIRLQHMKKWVDLIEAYHDKTGTYPLQGQTDRKLIVFIATPQQQSYTYQLPGAEHASMTTLVSALEQGLGRSINEYYDPQYVPDAKPNYYIYMLDGDDYFFAVHTHQNYAFSRNVAPDYNKVEVSNTHSRYTPKILTPKMLFKSQAFKQATSKAVSNAKFFQEREALTLHVSKQKKPN